MRCLSVVGARPQFVKSAIVEKALAGRDIEVLGVHTGQHYDKTMSEVFFNQLGIRAPYVNLGVGSGSHGAQTAEMIKGLENVVQDTRPDWVLVYGDTNSTLAATLAASKLCVPVAHVEAGLRSFNRRMPEEQNRIVADHLAAVLFAPSAVSLANLRNEGLEERCFLVGDVMRDVFDVISSTVDANGICREAGVRPNEFILATIHRAENTDDLERLRRIIRGLGLAPLPVLLPLHPRTRAKLAGSPLPASIIACEPIGYREMVGLEKACERIATDSGGVQKEALWAGKLCVTMRDETEWLETVESGWNLLVGADSERISDALGTASPRGTAPSLYGNGDAATRIAAVIEGVAP